MLVASFVAKLVDKLFEAVSYLDQLVCCFRSYLIHKLVSTWVDKLVNKLVSSPVVFSQAACCLVT